MYEGNISKIEEKPRALGLTLPKPIKMTATVAKTPPSWIGIRGNKAFISGHGPQNPDGSIAGPLGKVGGEISIEQGRRAARLATLSLLGTLRRELGNLDRITAWLMINGFVNVNPDFTETTEIVNACTELILELYGPEIGMHARTAMGVTTTPYGLTVVISAEVEIA